MKNLRKDRNDRKPWNTVSKRVSGKRIGAKGILQEVRYKKSTLRYLLDRIKDYQIGDEIRFRNLLWAVMKNADITAG